MVKLTLLNLQLIIVPSLFQLHGSSGGLVEAQLGQTFLYQGQTVWHRPAGLHDEGLALQP